jgi:hypothetical protein
LSTRRVSDDVAIRWFNAMVRRPQAEGRRHHFESGSMVLFGLDEVPDLRRAFVVTMTGKVHGIFDQLGRKLRRFRKYRVLLITELDSGDALQDALYRGVLMTPIGELRAGGSFEAAFDLVEYLPYILDVFERNFRDVSFGEVAWRQLQGLGPQQPL